MSVLDVQNISYLYRTGFRLENVSLGLKPGELVGVAGPNGSGKSTLLKLLAGLLAPASGTIRLDGVDLAQIPSRQRAARIAWVPQEMDVPPAFTVEEAVRMGLHPASQAGGWIPPPDTALRIEKTLKRMGLLHLRGRTVGWLSGGERRRVLLARSLAQGATVLLLDEPTAHLDPGRQAEFMAEAESLRRGGAAVMAAIHDVNLALEACTRVLLLDEGRLAADGPPQEALAPALLARVYGAHVRLVPGGDGDPGFIRFSDTPQEERT